MDDVLIIDDTVPVETQEHILNLCLSDDFTWYYKHTTVFDPKSNKVISPEHHKNVVDTPAFVHNLWLNNGINSHFFDAFRPIIETVKDIESYRLVRAQINLVTPYPGTLDTTHTFPHVDDYDAVDGDITCIYYINDSDGDTFIFNETLEHTGKVTVKQRITPKQGRMVIFNTRQLHAGNNPIKNYARLVFNFNLRKANNVS